MATISSSFEKKPSSFSKGVSKKKTLRDIVDFLKNFSSSGKKENSKNPQEESKIFFFYGPQDILLGVFSLLAFKVKGQHLTQEVFENLWETSKNLSFQAMEDALLFPQEPLVQFYSFPKDHHVFSKKNFSTLQQEWPHHHYLFLGSSSYSFYKTFKDEKNFLSLHNFSPKESAQLLRYGVYDWKNFSWKPEILEWLAHRSLDGSWLPLLKTLEVYQEEPFTLDFLTSLFPPSLYEEGDIFFHHHLHQLPSFYPPDTLAVVKLWQRWLWQILCYHLLYYDTGITEKKNRENIFYGPYGQEFQVYEKKRSQEQSPSSSLYFGPSSRFLGEEIFQYIEPKVFPKYQFFIGEYAKGWSLDIIYHLSYEALVLEEALKTQKTDGLLLMKNFLLYKKEFPLKKKDMK